MEAHLVLPVAFWLVYGQVATDVENGVRNNRIWARILGVEKTVVEGVEFDDGAGCVVVSVRPATRARSRCGVCRRRCPGMTAGRGADGGGLSMRA